MTLITSMQIQFNHLFIAAVLIIKVLGSDNLGDRLMKDVFDGYQQDVRPLCDPYPYTVTPDLGIAIRQLIELNNPEQKLTTSIWFRTRWKDCRLLWNVSDYQNLSRIIVPIDRIWIPDLTLYEK
ncbi:neuronal acetylcholine receptor subunit alpha-5 [Elysia marginata]|uniref:Neuronal acetylcholine receptor subunit alpha-5 n=1 Tax=Elysia marginata TaxID=1093978 RepID=A0AAV4I6L3_9GAST|nr:neuronal acetylcholine receptor subunit alpha-5 [Elysia marginata]